MKVHRLELVFGTLDSRCINVYIIYYVHVAKVFSLWEKQKVLVEKCECPMTFCGHCIDLREREGDLSKKEEARANFSVAWGLS